MDRLPKFPIVLHGASSVMPEYVALVNQFGGQMADAIGIPEDMLRKAASMAVCKINVDSDLRLAMTAGVRKHLAENPTPILIPVSILAKAANLSRRLSSIRSKRFSAARTAPDFRRKVPVCLSGRGLLLIRIGKAYV